MFSLDYLHIGWWNTLLNIGRSYVNFFLYFSRYHCNYHHTVKYTKIFGTTISHVVIGCCDYCKFEKWYSHQLGTVLKFSSFLHHHLVIDSFLSYQHKLPFVFFCVTWAHTVITICIWEGRSVENENLVVGFGNHFLSYTSFELWLVILFGPRSHNPPVRPSAPVVNPHTRKF